MRAAALSPEIRVPRTYAELRRGIEQVLFTGRAKVEEAWVRTYHETGRLIHEHVLRSGDRADYGAKLLPRLSADTGVSVRTLRECVQFYRVFPIRRPVAELGWNQCRLLCQVGDEGERAALIEELKRERLRTVDLKSRVRRLNAALRFAEARAERKAVPLRSGSASLPLHDASLSAETASLLPSTVPLRLLKAKRGTPDHYRVITRDGAPAVDVGFKLYTPRQRSSTDAAWRAGAFVRWDGVRFHAAPDATFADLFTYRVTVRRVIDGDTLNVTVALPLYAMDEKLRLRGLDCPELDTPEGKAAKRRVEELIATAREVVITTSKVDKYDRYLADVHLFQPDGDWRFLNNTLLREGHATPMGAEAMEEWVP